MHKTNLSAVANLLNRTSHFAARARVLAHATQVQAIALISLFAFAISIAKAAPPPPSADREAKNIKGPSDEGQRAIGKFKVPEGLKVELFAAEPMLANPVALRTD